MPAVLKNALLWAMLALFAACSDSASRLSPIPPDGVILSFGDSLTYGTGAPRDQSYPAQLQRLSRRTVINAGVPGELSAQGLARLPGVLEQYQPDLLILCHGGNDILRGLPADELQRNLAAMIEAARTQNVQVLLIGVPERTLFLHTAPLYEALAGRFEIPLADEVLADVLSDRELKSDRVHPNARGYGRIANAVHALLQSRGALP